MTNPEEITKLKELVKEGVITQKDLNVAKKLIEEFSKEGKGIDVKDGSSVEISPVIVIQWILAIIGFLSCLIFILMSFWGMVFVLISSLLIFPPFRKKYLKKFSLRLRYAFLISIILYFVGMIIIVAKISTEIEIPTIDSESPISNVISRVTPKELEFTSSEDSILLSYKCDSSSEVVINGRIAPEEIVKKICNANYKYVLKDGENNIEVKIKNGTEVLNEMLVIYFDEEANKVYGQADLSVNEILTARNKYSFEVLERVSEGWVERYNTNTKTNHESSWLRLDIRITNNNSNIVLDTVTSKIVTSHLPGSDGKTESWGRLVIDVGNIEPGSQQNVTVYYPGDLSMVTVVNDVYIVVEEEISLESYNFFEELD